MDAPEKSLGEVINDVISGLAILNQHVNLNAYMPIRHDAQSDNFGDAVAYQLMGFTERKEFRGTIFENVDGEYYAVVENGKLWFHMNV